MEFRKTNCKCALFLLGILLLLAPNCTDPNSSSDNELLKSANESRNKNKDQQELKKDKELTVDEINGILFMREEEKLAHDVYDVMYSEYEHQIFYNIRASEQQHMDAVLGLIDYFNLKDPAEGNANGVFENDELQELYDYLIEKGEKGLDSALTVGVIIEETDIEDLELHIAETEVEKILLVYGNLLDGSNNHLVSFNKVLDKLK